MHNQKIWTQILHLGNCFFGSVNLTDNGDLDKYRCSSYSIGFDFLSEFLFTDASFRKNVIFGANMSLSLHIDNKRKDILILNEGPTQRSYDTTVSETKYSINFMQLGKRFV